MNDYVTPGISVSGLVVLIGALTGAVVAILKQLQSANREIHEVKTMVDDPDTGLAATHAVANSGLENTQKAAKKADQEISRLNQAAADLAAKQVEDITALMESAMANTIRQVVVEAMSDYEAKRNQQ